MKNKVTVTEIAKEKSLKMVYGILGFAAVLIIFIMLLP